MDGKKNSRFQVTPASAIVFLVIFAAACFLTASLLKNWKSKVMQKHGYAALVDYHTAAQGAFAEAGMYAGDFVSVGFNPTRELFYRIDTVFNRAAPNTQYSETCTHTGLDVDCNCGLKDWACIPPIFKRHPTTNGHTVGPAREPCTDTIKVTDSEYLVSGGARILKGSSKIDCLTIDHNKVITHLEEE